jgi:hypothetical protein
MFATSLLLYPGVVVGAGAGQGGVEHPLLAEPDADRDWQVLRAAAGGQAAAHPPGVVVIEPVKIGGLVGHAELLA